MGARSPATAYRRAAWAWRNMLSSYAVKTPIWTLFKNRIMSTLNRGADNGR